MPATIAMKAVDRHAGLFVVQFGRRVGRGARAPWPIVIHAAHHAGDRVGELLALRAVRADLAVPATPATAAAMRVPIRAAIPVTAAVPGIEVR
jgi:hypothetical protein